MKISDVILQLQELKEIHGDLDVVSQNDWDKHYGMYDKVTSVRFQEKDNMLDLKNDSIIIEV